MPPRLHGTIAYIGALLVFLLVVAVRGATADVVVLGALWTIHYIRRASESLFVHRHRNWRVSASEGAATYVYYWGFGSWIAISLTEPSFRSPNVLWLAAGIALFLLGEAGNTWFHLRLRRLRAPGTEERVMPTGGLFNLVSCPHYLFEILSWIGFALAAQVMAAYAFLALGTAILMVFAWQRHRAYRRAFDGREGRPLYPPKRRALVPFVF
jgi:very-long-chain enoyl-CoA reductase